MVPVVDLAQRLVRSQSVTPAGSAVFDILATRLEAAGFRVERPVFGEGEAAVENLVATWGDGAGNAPHIALCGHVDVVPTGDPDAWHHPPFDGVIADGILHGRGAQDMKGGVAAMTAAAIDWAQGGAGGGRGAITLLITGDEEGPAVNGTRRLVDWCRGRFDFNAAIVGEPTSRERLGDVVKIGRRGSLTGTVTVLGKQGHAAYPEAADNPVPRALALAQSLLPPLDDGTAHFQPSNLEIVSIDVGNPADNVIPASITIRFNVRFNDEWTSRTLIAALEERMASANAGRTDVSWRVSGEAFRAQDPALLGAVAAAVEEVTGLTPVQSTTGGTSDARFLIALCPTVEVGAVGDRMHQVDEQTSTADLETLAEIYAAILRRLVGDAR